MQQRPLHQEAAKACEGLIAHLQDLHSILQLFEHRPEDRADTMPANWRQKALPQIAALLRQAKDAEQQALQGDPMPAVQICAQVTGLTRDLDWNAQWMGEPGRELFAQQLQLTSAWAGRWHRQGMQWLTKEPPCS